MTRDDITTAFKARLADAGLGIPGVWPNINDDPAVPITRPYFDVTFATADRTAGSISGGGGYVERGRVQVAIAVDRGTGTVAADTYADAVAALFPMALRLSITGGVLTITGEPTIRPGYPVDAEYRVPVVLTYSAISN